ncbi:MAG: DUF1643 domain-containing protein [Bifidobacterium asteroides]
MVDLYAGVRPPGKEPFQAVNDPIGSENDEFTREAISKYSDSIIAAWGNGSGDPPKFTRRCRALWAMPPKTGIYCLGTKKEGQPRCFTLADRLFIQNGQESCDLKKNDNHQIYS